MAVAVDGSPMVAESPFALLLLTVVAVAYALLSAVPRVDRKPDGYRKFVALSTLGIAYLVLIAMLAFVGDNLPDVEPVEQVLWLAVFAYLLFGVALLYDVFDDWLRLFVDPDYNTLVEASLVVAVLVVLAVFFVLVP